MRSVMQEMEGALIALPPVLHNNENARQANCLAIAIARWVPNGYRLWRLSPACLP